MKFALLLMPALVSLVSAQCEDTMPSGKKCGDADFFSEADPEACSYFYDCVLGCVTREQCAPLAQDGLPRVYDENYSWCGYTDDIDCGSRPCLDLDMCVHKTTTIPTPTTPDCGTVANCTALGNGYHPDPYNCRKYWHCFSDGGEHKMCPDDPATGVPEVFDLVYMGCNFQAQTDCGDRPICDECDNNCQTTTTPPPDCSTHPMDCTSKPDGWYADDWNCRKYWHCLGGIGAHFMCDEELQYNPSTIQCDFDARVDCGDRPVCSECDEDCHPDTGGGNDADCGPDDHHPPTICQGKPDGWYPDTFNCAKYWHCSAGHGDHFLCAQGLVYEATMVQCDWPERVNCQGRPTCDSCDENCH